MIYLLLGEDGPAKDNKISEIKKKHIQSNEALEFDYELLYGSKLHPDDLQKALLSLPVVSSRRLVIVRTAHKLSPRHCDILNTFLETPQEHVHLALEAQADQLNRLRLDEQRARVKTFRFASKKKMNVFDMTKVMARGNTKKALQMLSDLLADGDAPLRIMGGLVWFWGRSQRQLSAENYHKGLSLLQEADFHIKRSRLRTDYALELLVTKLTSLF
jgi:DNA polymerase III delta subunit